MRNALLVIDVQVGIINHLSDFEANTFLRRIKKLISKARVSRTPVIYLQYDGSKGHPLEVGSAGWHIHPAIAPLKGERIIRKTTCDSFYKTPLRRELTSRAITHLIVVGCMTEYCVDTTCRRAPALGFDVILVKDGHTTCDNGVLEANQIIPHHNELLHGLSIGQHTIRVKPTAAIKF